ncbi:MAG: hypothetical protein HOI43_10460, partial [Gammaproteobacteria bacterium]|nr:hypothetical protein [Gammaproteobacteria bacterium]
MDRPVNRGVETIMVAAQKHLIEISQKLDQGLSFIKDRIVTNGKIDASQENLYQQAIYDLALSKAEVECALAFLANATQGSEMDRTLADAFSA